MTEIVIVLVVVVVVLMCLISGLISSAIGRSAARQLRDSTQVRTIMQNLVTWSANSKESYPLPSAVDLDNATVAEDGQAKDTTANIFSMLIQNGSAPPEMFVSPAEVNRSIKTMKTYEFVRPKRAVNADKALWDPNFSADFTEGRIGNTSYAHLPAVGARRTQWRNTLISTEPVLGNRGPEIASVNKGAAPVVMPNLVRADSKPLLIHGSRNQWEGNVAYNDSHVNFEVRTVGTNVNTGWLTVYKDPQGTAWNDCLFYDEPDDAAGTNAYLGIFTKAGKTAAEFKAIWD